MVVVPLKQTLSDSEIEMSESEAEQLGWVSLVAGGALLAGGFLLLAGRRRAGLLAAASGAALALLDQQETLREWWGLVPGYVDDAQRLLVQVQDTVEDLAAKREKLRQVLAR
jgi:hypothetical protein